MTGVQTCALPIYTATTEIYTTANTLSLHDALPISVLGILLYAATALIEKRFTGWAFRGQANR